MMPVMPSPGNPKIRLIPHSERRRRRKSPTVVLMVDLFEVPQDRWRQTEISLAVAITGGSS
jgi:hypothetical protein